MKGGGGFVKCGLEDWRNGKLRIGVGGDGWRKIGERSEEGEWSSGIGGRELEQGDWGNGGVGN